MEHAQALRLWKSGELPEDQSLRESIHYSGRKAARAKSEHRRLQILEATLRIAARDGLRGIKHPTTFRKTHVTAVAKGVVNWPHA